MLRMRTAPAGLDKATPQRQTEKKDEKRIKKKTRIGVLFAVLDIF